MKIGEKSTDDVMPVYSFSVIINGGLAMQFNKISNIGAELEYETYCEGGMNSYAHILPNPATSAGKLSLTRYVRSNMLESKIYVGMKMGAPLYVGVSNANQSLGKIGGKAGAISAQAEMKKGFSFLFTGCLVTSHHFSELDAQHSALMEETIEIAYEKMFYIPGLGVTASMSIDF